MPEAVRLVVIDDHSLYLAGIERTFRRAEGVRLVATGTSGRDAVELCERELPDVMLLDIGIPGGGLNALRQITLKHSTTKVIMLTGSDDDEHLDEALAKGARGYLLKGASANEICDAVVKVAAGAMVIDSATVARLFDKHRTRRTAPLPGQQLERLNAQEKKIFELMSEGATNREIGARLELSVSTVRNYVSRILRKLNVRNRVMAISSRQH